LTFTAQSKKLYKILSGSLTDEFKSALVKVFLGYEKAALTEIMQKTEIEHLIFCQNDKYVSLESGRWMTNTLRQLAFSLRNEKSSSAEKKA
jgi:hypothetical protein